MFKSGFIIFAIILNLFAFIYIYIYICVVSSLGKRRKELIDAKMRKIEQKSVSRYGGLQPLEKSM
jgi:predicted membrane protein